MATSTLNIDVKPTGFIAALATELRTAANRLDPIDRDELKAVIVSLGDTAPAEIADAMVAWLARA